DTVAPPPELVVPPDFALPAAPNVPQFTPSAAPLAISTPMAFQAAPLPTPYTTPTLRHSPVPKDPAARAREFALRNCRAPGIPAPLALLLVVLAAAQGLLLAALLTSKTRREPEPNSALRSAAPIKPRAPAAPTAPSAAPAPSSAAPAEASAAPAASAA